MSAVNHPLPGVVVDVRDLLLEIKGRCILDVPSLTVRHGERVADVTATPIVEPEGAVIVTLQERSLAQRIDRQLLHRGAVRSMHGMAAVLAHEGLPSGGRVKCRHQGPNRLSPGWRRRNDAQLLQTHQG